ncbi:response regulator [bacterium]|nr:response regulator [bacterium]
MGGERLLVVDDNLANQKLASVLLEDDGFTVRTAANASEALALVESFSPRLILMDVELPGMSGLELVERLRADPETSTTTIVAFTAYAMKGDEQRALAAGCDGYITKPIDTRRFAATIRGYLARGRAGIPPER